MPLDNFRMKYYSALFASDENYLRALRQKALSENPVFTGKEYVYLHTTKEAYLPSIKNLGLIPGFREGMGEVGEASDPNRRKKLDDGVYVVLPGQHILDAYECNVYIITETEPHPDVNYKGLNREFISGYFSSPIKPLSSIRLYDRAKIYCFTIEEGGELDHLTRRAILELGLDYDETKKMLCAKVAEAFPTQYHCDILAKKELELTPTPAFAQHSPSNPEMMFDMDDL